MKLDIVDQKGKSTSKKAELETTVFEAKVNDALEAQALKVHRYNQRKWSAKTKDKSEVRGGGAKPWAQKGTGRARHGSRRSPLWVGGGVTFGPAPKDKKLRIGSGMRKSAIRSAFSRKAAEKVISVVDSLKIKDGKFTKQMVEIVEALKPELMKYNKTKMAFIVADKESPVFKAASNIQDVKVLLPEAINIYELTNSDYLVFTPEALAEVNKIWKKRI